VLGPTAPWDQQPEAGEAGDTASPNPPKRARAVVQPPGPRGRRSGRGPWHWRDDATNTATSTAVLWPWSLCVGLQTEVTLG